MKALVVLAIVVALALIQWFRPLPPVTLVPDAQALGALSRRIPATPLPRLPAQGEAALAIPGVGSLGTSGGDTPVPIASLAKLMTAYLVLKKMPLAPYASGPTFTVTPADVAVYERDLAGQQSVVKVVAGERLSERQLLEALLVPSANNVATLLARRVAGSEAAFVALMNRTAKALGLSHTHYADASGASPETQSTAVDQLRLAEILMRNPTFAEIVAKPQVTLPVVGVAYNVDYVLGQDGIVGVKTGSTNQAGGCFVFAARRRVAGATRLIMGAVLGQQGVSIIWAALDAGKRLVKAASLTPRQVQLLRRGMTVGSLSVPWGQAVPVVAGRSVRFLGWRGLPFHWRIVGRHLGIRIPAGTVVGTLTLSLGEQRASVPLIATRAVPSPGVRYRLTRL